MHISIKTGTHGQGFGKCQVISRSFWKAADNLALAQCIAESCTSHGKSENTKVFDQ